jgi:hypothetical protein
MNYRNDAHHPCKQNVYPCLAKALNGHGAKKILTFPSTEAKELVYLLEVGKITVNDHIVAIEGRADLVPLVKARLEALGFRSFQILQGKAENLAKEIIDLHLQGRFDLIFLDFCGNLKTDTAKLLSDIRFVLRDTEVAATFNLNFRGCPQELENNDRFFEYSLGEEGSYSVIGINEASKSYLISKAEWTCGRFWESLEVEDYDLLHSVIIYSDGQPMIFFMHKGVPSFKNEVKNRSMLKLLTEIAKKSRRESRVAAATKSWEVRKNRENAIKNLMEQYAQTSSAGVKAAIKKKVNKIKRGEMKGLFSLGYTISGYENGVMIKKKA